MRRDSELLKACDAMSPKDMEAFLAMVWNQDYMCYDLPGVRRIWESGSESAAMTALLMFQYGVVIGKRMERMKRRK